MSVTVTPLADGGRVDATWAGGNSPVHLQKYDANGAPVGAEYVDSYSSNQQPQVVALSNGGYAVLVGFVFKGAEYPVYVFDAAGQKAASLEAAGSGIGVTLAASPSGGFMVVSMDQHYDNSGGPAGVDLSWRPFLTLYDNAGGVVRGPVGLAGDKPTVTVEGDGHYQVSWVDGNITHQLDIDPAHPPVLDKPATPTLTMVDDQGERTGAIAGPYTNDLTPVARVSVSEVGWVEISREGGSGNNERTMDGGVAVTAADVARGYIDVPMDGDVMDSAPYGFFARFKDADGVVSDAAVARLNMFKAADIWSMTDDTGPSTGRIADGGTTDDATPTLRVGLETSGLAAGGVVRVFDGNQTVAEVTLTDQDVARGYVDVTTSALADGDHTLRAWNNPIPGLRLTVSGGGVSAASGDPETGHAYTSPGPNSTVAGGAGDDTITASGGGDTLTGGAGADQFVFKTSPWSPVHITDFAVGTDKLDFSAVFNAAGYTGSDPVADKVIWLQSDGAGGTQVLFDRDGTASGQQWPDYAIDLEHVPTAGLTWAKLTGAAAPTATYGTVNISPATVSHAEGDTGVTAFSFTLTRTGDASQAATTNYRVTGSGEHPIDAADLQGASLPNVGFAWDRGETSKTITINVQGDTTPEADETFSVTLLSSAGSGSNPTAIGPNAVATGVLVNDDGSTAGTPGQVYNSPGPNSTVAGGAGDDTLNASQGADVLTGNGGADTFAYAHLPWTHGRITDFHLGEDRLDLSGMLRDIGYTGADPVADGYVRLTNDLGGANTLVYFDADGAGTAHQWDGFFTTLEGVYGAGGAKGGVSTLTWAQVSGGGSTQPPPPPPSGDGQAIASHQYGDTLSGTAGNDTLTAGQGPDRMTGGGGADRFVFPNPPWNAGHITDFTPGADKLDLSALFSGYHGADPLADHWLEFRADGAGNTQVYVDHDGPNAGDWPFLITTLDGVAPGQVGAGDWIVG